VKKITTFALVGNPNCGKSTLFNALTGLQQKVGNYTGVTVEKREGKFFSQHGVALKIIDLPGLYSLHAQSPDEQITVDVLSGLKAERPDYLLAVVDTLQLERQLYLVLQLLELGIPTFLIMNKVDLAADHGLGVDGKALSQLLGIPVIPTQATQSKSLIALKVALSKTLEKPPASLFQQKAGNISIDNEAPSAQIKRRYAQVAGICEQVINKKYPNTQPTLTEKIDQWLMHPIWGIPILISILGILFYSIFYLAEYPKSWIEGGMEWIGHAIEQIMPAGQLVDLIVHGIIAGVGAVLAFLPQIILLFLGIGLLEATGYLARAAFTLDRPMQRVGLRGACFIPFLSSYACAIPGIMATRSINCPKDRLATILIAPWASCSARLPVYLVMIQVLTGSHVRAHALKSAILLGLYALGTFSAFAAAWIFRKTIIRGKSGPAIIELPPYQKPDIRFVCQEMLMRAQLFITKAGTLILGLSIIMWYSLSHPIIEGADAATQLAQSYGGRLGIWLEPVLAPLGFDWKIGIALISSFAAREVFISTLGIIYGVERMSISLEEALTQAHPAAYTPLTCLSLLVFYVYAMQCMSTLAIVKRETQTWKWPIFQLGYMTGVAYVASYLVYQIGQICLS